jgi:hypothetical protein
MTQGTKSVDVTEAPTDTGEWKKLTGQIAADLLNRKRELAEVNCYAKLAKTVSETIHAETRRALAQNAIGSNIGPVGTA